MHSAQNDKSRGTFCTKGNYGGMSGKILCPRVICPGGGGTFCMGGNLALKTKTEINLCVCI